MKDSSTAPLAAAIATGYLLGRTKKGKVAVAVASAVVGRHLPTSPKEALAKGAQGVSSQLGGTARQIADHQINSLADRLQARTDRLTGTAEAADAEEEADTEAEDEADDGATDAQGPDEEAPDEPAAEQADDSPKRSIANNPGAQKAVQHAKRRK